MLYPIELGVRVGGLLFDRQEQYLREFPPVSQGAGRQDGEL